MAAPDPASLPPRWVQTSPAPLPPCRPFPHGLRCFRLPVNVRYKKKRGADTGVGYGRWLAKRYRPPPAPSPANTPPGEVQACGVRACRHCDKPAFSIRQKEASQLGESQVRLETGLSPLAKAGPEKLQIVQMPPAEVGQASPRNFPLIEDIRTSS